jgi:hypothetical protein
MFWEAVYLDKLTMNLEVLDVFRAEQVGLSTNRANNRYPETLCHLAKNLAEYSLEVLNNVRRRSVKLRYLLLWR